MPPKEVSTQQPETGLESTLRWCWSYGSLPWVKAVFLLLALVYLLGLAHAGLGPINSFETDAFIELDGAWRVYNGQIPHRDFYLALGPLEYMVSGLGMMLTKASPNGIVAGNILFGVISGAWGWLLVRRRMPVVPALLATAWLLLMATCPTPLGFPQYLVTAAEIYNRHGYVLLALILIECSDFFLDLDSPRTTVWRGISSGAALVMLLFLKLNFFGGAIILLAASLPWQLRDGKRFLGLLLGAVATAFGFFAYLHFSFRPFLHDMAFATRTRSSTLGSGALIRGLVYTDAQAIEILAVTIILIVLMRTSSAAGFSLRRTVALGIAVIASGVALRQTNFDETDIALTGLWVLLAMGQVAATYPSSKEKFAVAVAIALCLPLLYADFAQSVKSFGYLMSYSRKSQAQDVLTIANPNVSGMRFHEEPDKAGAAYLESINDGLALLQKVSGPQDRILALGHNNPFPYILRRPPMHGGSPWFLLGNNISLQHMPAAEEFFGDATILMIRHLEGNHSSSDQEIAKAYEPFIEEHYGEVAHSALWTVYRRKQD